MDLIQSEYGWSDNAVLDLPVCRLRQIVANIEMRLKASRLYKKTITEWQTKTIAQFIAGTVPVDKGKKNSLAEAADKIELRMEDDEGTSEDDTPMDVYLEEGSQKVKNEAGSYEQLSRAFGGALG